MEIMDVVKLSTHTDRRDSFAANKCNFVRQSLDVSGERRQPIKTCETLATTKLYSSLHSQQFPSQSAKTRKACHSTRGLHSRGNLRNIRIKLSYQVWKHWALCTAVSFCDIWPLTPSQF